MAKMLGIDYGTKRIGIALSDESGLLAFPHATLLNDGQLAASIVDICKREDVAGIVIGESRDFSGKENLIMKEVHLFAATLESGAGLPVHFEPEFLTTAQSRRSGIAKEHLDASSAALILQSYFDRTKK